MSPTIFHHEETRLESPSVGETLNGGASTQSDKDERRAHRRSLWYYPRRVCLSGRRGCSPRPSAPQAECLSVAEWSTLVRRQQRQTRTRRSVKEWPGRLAFGARHATSLLQGGISQSLSSAYEGGGAAGGVGGADGGMGTHCAALFRGEPR